MSIQNTINHFSHNHPLTEVNGVGTYTCDGCKLYGAGKTYRCSDCDYDLHEYCATCPQSLINSCHGPSHELSLINGPMHTNERVCYACRVYIQGMFYKCKHCSFESHPLCTHVPMHAPSPDHETLTKERSLHDHSSAGQPSYPHHYGQGNPYGYPHMGPFGSYPYGGHYPPPPSSDETVTKERSLHDHSSAGQPSYPHQYGQGNPYGYPHMGPFGPYPYGGHYPPPPPPHQYQYDQHQQQHMDSPKADHNPGPSTTPKTKKKKGGFLGAMEATLGVVGVAATNLLVATIAGSASTEEEVTL